MNIIFDEVQSLMIRLKCVKLSSLMDFR